MNASASAAKPAAFASTGGGTLLGFGPLLRKELLEWWRSRRALVVLLVVTPIVALNVLSGYLALWSSRVSHQPLMMKVSLDPTANVLGKWDQWLFVFAIGMSLSLVVGERDRGTLAWTLTKPVSRTSVLAAKWAAAVVMGTVFGLLLPMAACVLVAVPAYGVPDLRAVAVATALQVTVPAFFVALNLWLGVILPSQIGVAAVALLVAIAPGIIGSVAPGVAAVLPPSIGAWAVGSALGAPVDAVTPLGWAVGTAVVAALGVRAIRELEF